MNLRGSNSERNQKSVRRLPSVRFRTDPGAQLQKINNASYSPDLSAHGGASDHMIDADHRAYRAALPAAVAGHYDMPEAYLERLHPKQKDQAS